ncbi:MAG: ribosome-associated translation inhibitor RaiA [Ferruginibacter sp.]|nr:ribosome-associated translation inhibitor RaiA [Chitinophagaceae bacterium]
MMQINIQSPGIKLNQKLNGFVQEKVEKLFNYYSELISIDITLRVSNSETKENKICEIRLVIPGNDILASAQCKTFEEGVLSVVEIIKVRLKRKKSKIIGTRNDFSPKHLPN